MSGSLPAFLPLQSGAERDRACRQRAPHRSPQSTAPGTPGSAAPPSAPVLSPPASDREAAGSPNRRVASCCPPPAAAMPARPAKSGGASPCLLQLPQDHRHVGSFDRTNMLVADHAASIDDEAFGNARRSQRDL